MLLKTAGHALSEPSAWVVRWARLIKRGGTVLDLACGSGRHLRWLAAQGFQVTGVDRDATALLPLAGLAEVIVADIEAAAWPLAGRRFDAIVITHYLWRALGPTLVSSLASGGVLIHETFAQGQGTVGKPSRADFLLLPGELLSSYAALRVVAYEDGFLADPPRFVQRIAAVAQAAAQELPARYALGPGS